MAIFNALTYEIPLALRERIIFGIRVEVSVRNKLYSGIVVKVHQSAPAHKVKPIGGVLDADKIITEAQYELWQWMSSYYCCSLGEVMSVALPSGLKLSSETKVVLNSEVSIDEVDLTDDEYLVAEALTIQEELTIQVIQDILNKKTVYPVIRSLLDKKILFVKEELKQKTDE